MKDLIILKKCTVACCLNMYLHQLSKQASQYAFFEMQSRADINRRRASNVGTLDTSFLEFCVEAKAGPKFLVLSLSYAWDLWMPTDITRDISV